MSFNEFTSNKRKVDLSGSKDRTDRKQILDKAAQQRAQRQAEKDRLHAAIVIQVGSCSIFMACSAALLLDLMQSFIL